MMGVPDRCPDRGACHHECGATCFRVTHCGPLSNVYPGDVWPDDVRAEHGSARGRRIEWISNGMDSERGRVNGHDFFHLAYPGDWSECFTLTSPLIFSGDRMGWLGTIEVADPGRETEYRQGKRPSRAQIIADAKADKERWNRAKNATKAVAEALLIDFARSVLKGADAK